MKKDGADQDSRTFEVELKDLQDAVSRLESGSLSLEESIRQFESGCACLRACYRILGEAKSRIEILAKDYPGEEPTWKPFEGSEGGEREEDGSESSSRKE